MREQKKRSLAKTLSWRIIASLTTMIVVFIFTGNVLLSAGIGGVEFASKIILYYFHERGWNKVKWGRN